MTIGLGRSGQSTLRVPSLRACEALGYVKIRHAERPKLAAPRTGRAC